MYTVLRMKIMLTVLLLLAAMFAGVAQPMSLSLPPVEKVDTEVVTNVSLSVLSRRAGHVKCKVKNGECRMFWGGRIFHYPFSIFHMNDANCPTNLQIELFSNGTCQV